MTENDRNKGFKDALVLIAVVAVILLTVAAYANASQGQIENYARYVVQQNAHHISEQVNAYVANAISNIQLTSHLVTKTMTSERLENAPQVLSTLLDQTPFNFIEYIDKDGINTTELGEQFDASDRVYYREGITGRTDIWINFSPRYSQEFLLNFYTPLRYEEQIVGVLTGTMGSDTNILPMLETNFFGEEVVGFVCDEDLRMVACTKAMPGKAVLTDILMECGIFEDGQQAVRTHLRSGDDSVFTVYGIKGNSIVCVTRNERTGWSVYQIVPAEAFRRVLQRTAIAAYQAILVVTACLVFYLWHMVRSTRQKQQQAEKESHKKLAEQKKLSHTDNLTGLGNRWAYEEDLLRLGFIPEDSDFVYVSADVNGLKIVNDNLGHAAGDELLSGAAQCLKQCLGPYGSVFRIGGDEYAALIYTKLDKLELIEKDLRDTVSGWRGERVQDLSISVGCASRREFPNLSVQDLAQKADERMYRAKALHYSTSKMARREQHSAYSALCSSFTKILNVNLTEDRYQIVCMDFEERTEEFGFAERISQWLREFGKSGQIHPEDLQRYLEQTDLEALRERFHKDRSPLEIRYRRKTADGWASARMELIPTEKYKDEAQTLYLYVKKLG